ncbi:SGNH/GDSL hydrolase family protein [Ruminococcus sp. HUN007]|uniref:SGNH/GDSL hydrolase family protein n=1 Tax=Ruminococcus sp. HUN007 TaxID=1514668 RepID=UPI0005D1E0BD|nr:SGNH/GDSL hydrolase family protein [Ruminococcus sp. HUN007]
MKGRIIALLLSALFLPVLTSGCGAVNESDAAAAEDGADEESVGTDVSGSSSDQPADSEEQDTEESDTEVKNDTPEPTGKDHSIKKKMKSEEVFDILYGSWVSDNSDDELIFSAGVGDISYKAELVSSGDYGFSQLVSYFDAAQKNDGVKIRFITGNGGLGSCKEMLLSDDQQSLKYKTGFDIDENGEKTVNYITFRKKSDTVIPGPDGKWKGCVGAFLGDSITAGFNTSDGKGYWDYLGEILGLKEAIPYGVAGSCISSQSDMGTDIPPFVERYKDIKRDADFIVIFGGTNDYGFNTPLGTEDDTTDVSFYGALYELLMGLKKEHPGASIVFLTPLHRVEFGGLNTDKQRNEAGYTLYHYIDAIKNRCQRMQIPVIDTNTIYGMNPQDDFVKNNYLTDGLHPNEEGHRILAERIASCFEGI